VKIYLSETKRNMMDDLLCPSGPVDPLAQDHFYCACLPGLGAVVLVSNTSHSRKLFMFEEF
jgi:hypothetical protein